MTFGTRSGLAVVLTWGLVACAAVAPPVSKLPDGSYRIACNETLSRCLGAFETICAWHGYDVISASERKRRADLRDVPEETVTSEAQVRCRPGEAIFGSSPAPASAVAPAPNSPATPEPPNATAPAVVSAAPQPDGGGPPCGGPSPVTPAAAPPALPK